MDASLLMRDDPGECYVESDLRHVIRAITENASWLRFATTKKFLSWRGMQSDTSLIMSHASSEGFAMARVGDHIDREERLARVRLVQWAGDMRRTVRQRMQEEREAFEHVESQDRVKWLVARLNEAVSHETALVPTSQTIRRASIYRKRHAHDRDPLGLVWVKERWGPRVQKSIVWIVEAGVVFGSGWVVWRYVVDPGLTGWFVGTVRAT
jgi:hypothetical protein